LAVYLSAVNLMLFVLMALDKRRARRGGWRVPEKTLFWLAAMGGSLGGLLAMRLFRHKTKKPAFTVGFGLLFVLHAALLGWLLSQNIL
jgi:uncharacterized membrane protein YsdA (DUF1294 family)